MNEKYVYVVTRNKRRIEKDTYTSAEDANLRAEQLRYALKEWDPSDSFRVNVVKTKKPNQIR